MISPCRTLFGPVTLGQLIPCADSLLAEQVGRQDILQSARLCVQHVCQLESRTFWMFNTARSPMSA